MSSEPSFQFLKETIYEAPSWAKHLNNVPSGKMTLGQLPTPIHKWHPPGFPPNLEMYIKREDLSEQHGIKFDDIVITCASGGATGGLALGNHFSGYGAQLVAYDIFSDGEDYFYNYMDEICQDLGVPKDIKSRQLLRVVQAQGAGYTINKEEELKYVMEVSRSTGVLLDPIYVGKALYHMMKETKEGKWEGDRKVLFLHTGGLIGMFGKEQQFTKLLQPVDRVKRMEVERSGMVERSCFSLDKKHLWGWFGSRMRSSKILLNH
eukprot:TRINITY_DN1387_c0_g1_i1.p1 TRINITY_DN1387_c0_g1~~TRINITY_DN1387_c0_g1_i1.p1  ORF type:complete len:307 (-),score=32.27 TRINITY_DN1387_c0_g1_i1:749-1537(-)